MSPAFGEAPMTIQYFTLANEEASKELANRFAKILTSGTIVTFSGEIGSGKTTFIRAILRAFGVQGAIKSPSFSLVETYVCESLCIHHFDFYRIHGEEELEFIGFRDYLTQDALCCIEWPELAENSLHTVDLHFSLLIQGTGRSLSIEAKSALGEKILEQI
jgi:tRNA threonylcarbamoyladenosine biosynthesis protein TsaE